MILRKTNKSIILEYTTNIKTNHVINHLKQVNTIEKAIQDRINHQRLHHPILHQCHLNLLPYQFQKYKRK